MPIPINRRTLLTTSVGLGLAMSRIDVASGTTDDEQWINEPKVWKREGSVLTIHAEPKTDFWRKTYFGYITDNGHILGHKVTGDFRATVNVAGKYAAQYDQAGLMVRQDSTVWMKCGVEFVDGTQHVSSVFTREFSDWAGVPRHEPVDSLWFRLVRKGSSLTFSFSVDSKTYTEVRQGYLTEAATVLVGVMAAAPEGQGFAATFKDLRIDKL
jgi:uncharacterized protein